MYYGIVIVYNVVYMDVSATATEGIEFRYLVHCESSRRTVCENVGR